MGHDGGVGGGWLQGDPVSEAFELADEASRLAFAVAEGEVVVAAEVAVGLAAGDYIPYVRHTAISGLWDRARAP